MDCLKELHTVVVPAAIKRGGKGSNLLLNGGQMEPAAIKRGAKGATCF